MTPRDHRHHHRRNRPRGVDDSLHDGVDRRFDGVDRRFDGVDRRFDDAARQNDAAHAQLNVNISELRADFRALITRPAAEPDQTA